jgi:broad specificity phosphatase PhoE
MDPSVPPREWRLGSEGEEQSRLLARRLSLYLPFALISSKEPKAVRTAQIVAAYSGVAPQLVEGLEEIDRPAMPIVTAEEHERQNAPLFNARGAPAPGSESADAASARFHTAMVRAVEQASSNQNLVVVSHGTVISLFVEEQTGVDAFTVWKRLGCGEFVTVRMPPSRSARAG